MQQVQNTQTGFKNHGSNPLLGMTFGVSHKITSVCLDIVRGQFAVFSISTGILGIVMEILGGSCTLTFNIAFLNQGSVFLLFSTVNSKRKLNSKIMVSSFTELHMQGCLEKSLK